MELDWFKDLAALARTGSFSRAAEQNHISQSAFSRRIKALEAWVGTELVSRASYPVTLTTPGRQILEAGQQAVDRVESERNHIRESLAQPDRYVVTFGSQHSIGWRFYPAWLQKFEHAFGPILSRLRADNLPDCVFDLQRGEVDFVIAYASAQSPHPAGAEACESVMIGTDALLPVCKASNDGTPLFSLEAGTQTIPYLRFGPGAPIGQHIEPRIDALGLRARLESVYENSMAGALRIRARDGLGVAWLPHSLVEPDIAAKLLVAAGADRWRVDLQVRLYRRDGDSNALLSDIWHFLKDRESSALH